MRVGINAWFLSQGTTGSGQYLRHLLRQFAQTQGVSECVLLVSPIQPGRDPALPLPPRRFRQIVLTTPLDRRNFDLAKLWFEQVSVPRAARRLELDLLHVPYWGSPLRPTTLTVVTVHDLIPLLLPAYRGHGLVRLYTRLVAAAARRADLVLTDSNASRQDILRHLGVPSARVRAIPLAPDPRFRPPDDPGALTDLRRKYGLPARYLFYLGGFDRRKNVPLLLRAFARFQARRREARLVVAGRLPDGDSAFFPDPRRVAAELCLEEAVQFIGWVPEGEKPPLYAGAEAFIFPSRYEGFGLPPLEAMACGTPAIGAAVSSLPEVIGNGGLLVPPDDAGALTNAMLQLWQDAALRRTLGQRAAAHAARFSWAQTARETLDAYARVATTTPS